MGQPSSYPDRSQCRTHRHQPSIPFWTRVCRRGRSRILERNPQQAHAPGDLFRRSQPGIQGMSRLVRGHAHVEPLARKKCGSETEQDWNIGLSSSRHLSNRRQTTWATRLRKHLAVRLGGGHQDSPGGPAPPSNSLWSVGWIAGAASPPRKRRGGSSVELATDLHRKACHEG